MRHTVERTFNGALHTYMSYFIYVVLISLPRNSDFYSSVPMITIIYIV